MRLQIKTVALIVLFLIPIQWVPRFKRAEELAKEKTGSIRLHFSGSD
jgi:hypothetical protein